MSKMAPEVRRELSDERESVLAQFPLPSRASCVPRASLEGCGCCGS